MQVDAIALQRATDAYDSLLAAIGARAGDIGHAAVAGHWPHVGSAYSGLVIVGQAVYGWGDQNDPATFQASEGRASAISSYRRSAGVNEPMSWITRSHHRTSPWWTTVRLLVDRLAPGVAPWHARFAWANLYPCAVDIPPGNPTGALREAQDPLVGDLLQAHADWLKAKVVVCLVGPFWWPTGAAEPFAALADRPRPLLKAGRIGGRPWVIGWHPTGASRRRFGPTTYAAIVADAATGLT
jgi:hypothetical protein